MTTNHTPTPFSIRKRNSGKTFLFHGDDLVGELTDTEADELYTAISDKRALTARVAELEAAGAHLLLATTDPKSAGLLALAQGEMRAALGAKS